MKISTFVQELNHLCESLEQPPLVVMKALLEAATDYGARNGCSYEQLILEMHLRDHQLCVERDQEIARKLAEKIAQDAATAIIPASSIPPIKPPGQN